MFEIIIIAVVAIIVVIAATIYVCLRPIDYLKPQNSTWCNTILRYPMPDKDWHINGTAYTRTDFDRLAHIMPTDTFQKADKIVEINGIKYRLTML